MVWGHAGKAVIVSASRKALSGEGYVEVPLSAAEFESHIIQKGNVDFGEFTDYRRVKVFGAARPIAIAGGNIACKVDRHEALAEFRERAVLEGMAGTLPILLFGLIITRPPPAHCHSGTHRDAAPAGSPYRTQALGGGF